MAMHEYNQEKSKYSDATDWHGKKESDTQDRNQSRLRECGGQSVWYR